MRKLLALALVACVVVYLATRGASHSSAADVGGSAGPLDADAGYADSTSLGPQSDSSGNGLDSSAGGYPNVTDVHPDDIDNDAPSGQAGGLDYAEDQAGDYADA
jgi:hypothetical protein